MPDQSLLSDAVLLHNAAVLNLEPEIILLPVALFHSENFDLSFNSFSKMSA